MKKYYKESDVAGSINSSSELSRVNNTISVNGLMLPTFIQPLLTEAGTLGGDSFAVSQDSISYPTGAQNAPAWRAFDGNENTWMQWHFYIIMYNPKPLLIKEFTYITEGRYLDMKEKIVLYGSDTGEFNGEEELIGRNIASVTEAKQTIVAKFPENKSVYKYHKIFWEETTGWANCGTVYPYLWDCNVPHIAEVRLSETYEVDSNQRDNYAKSIKVKEHVVTSFDGDFYVIPEQEFNIYNLENGRQYLFSNVKTKKIEALKGTFIASPNQPLYNSETGNIIWLDTSNQSKLKLYYISEEGKTEKTDLVKLGYVDLVVDRFITNLVNDEFNSVKKGHQYYLGNYKCGFNGGKTYMPVFPEFAYYKNTSSGVKKADKSNYDFFVVRPSFNVQDGGVMCFSKEDKNGVKS